MTRGLCLKIGEKMYLLKISTNVQNYGLRPDSNTNISAYMDLCIRDNMTINRIYTYMNDITVVNEGESFNELRRLNMEYEDISMNNFILTIDTADTTDISSTTINGIYLYDRPPIPDNVVEALFNDFDTCGNGFLTGGEIDAFSQASGIPIDELNALDSDSDEISLSQIKIMYKPLLKNSPILVNSFDDYNIITKYKNFWVKFMDKKYNDNMSKNDFNVITYEDLYSDFVTGIKCTDISGSVFTLLCAELRIQDIIKPSLSVEGDAKITGDLIIANKSTGTNYVTVDPDNYFMGIGTDERFINYQDRVYDTTSNMYTGRHNVHISHDTYPVMVVERIRELPESELSGNLVSFGSYSTLTAKRRSHLYKFDKLITNAAVYNAAYNAKFLEDNQSDVVSHIKYGPDISFEVCDKTDRTVELGQIGMGIDSMDDTGNLRGCFTVNVYDPDQSDPNKSKNVQRSIMYVDNTSTLYVKQINLNGGVLTTNTNGDLLWNGKKLITE